MSTDIPALIARATDLADKATPGPWGTRVRASDFSVQVRHRIAGTLTRLGCTYRDEWPQTKADAAFIAAARDLVPALCAALASRDADATRLRDAIEAHKADHTDPDGAVEGCCKPADGRLWDALSAVDARKEGA